MLEERERERERMDGQPFEIPLTDLCVSVSEVLDENDSITHTWVWRGNRQTYRDVSAVSLTLTEAWILLASQCCLEGVRSHCNHVWMVLACFLHILVLLALCKRNESSAQSHAPLLHKR